VWCDFATGAKGDLLDLICAVFGYDVRRAMEWALRWLGIEPGEAKRPPLPAPPKPTAPASDRWRVTWKAARPIAGTAAERYLKARGLRFDDPEGRVLRFHPKLARRHPVTDELEYYPGLIALVRSIHAGGPIGIHIIFLQPGVGDRLRCLPDGRKDRKAKVSRGQKVDGAVMLGAFEDVTMGLVIAEGVETAIALHQAECRPVWATCGAGLIRTFPVLHGIECLTVSADNGVAGQEAARICAERWRSVGCEALIITPPLGDWADGPAKRRYEEAAE
jgi:hypothetical protein